MRAIHCSLALFLVLTDVSVYHRLYLVEGVLTARVIQLSVYHRALIKEREEKIKSQVPIIMNDTGYVYIKKKKSTLKPLTT